MKRMKWEAPKLTVLTSPPQAHGKCKTGSNEVAGDCATGPAASSSKCFLGGHASEKCGFGGNATKKCTGGTTG